MVIKFGVEHLGNLVFEFTVNNDRGQVYTVQNLTGISQFKL